MRVTNNFLSKGLDAAISKMSAPSETKRIAPPGKVERQGSNISLKSAVLSENQIMELLQLERERRYAPFSVVCKAGSPGNSS
jgi:hypothetical protein